MGRPSKFETKKDLEVSINEYFVKDGFTAPNKAGLRVWLDISHQTYSRFKKKKHEFCEPIKRAEDLIESWWVTRLSLTGATGAIFYLKNAFKEDYKDRYDTDITSKGEKIIPIFNGRSISEYKGDGTDIQP